MRGGSSKLEFQSQVHVLLATSTCDDKEHLSLTLLDRHTERINLFL